MQCPICNSVDTKYVVAAPLPRKPSLVLSCLVMFLIWIVVIVLIVIAMTLAERFLFHGKEPETVAKIIGLLPMLSGVAILVGGLIRWVLKRDCHQLLISKQHDTWTCSYCQNSWTPQNG